MGGLLPSPEASVVLLLLGIYCFFRTSTNWRSGLTLLIFVVLFGGLIGLRLGSGAIAIAFRDLFIVAPLYMAFFLTKDGQQAWARMPVDLGFALLTIVVYVLLCLFNQGRVSPLQMVIGLKVWLFYLPFIFIGIAVAARQETMFAVFRGFLMLGLVACAVGLTQSFLVRILGYQSTMTLFFGAQGARAATQGFTYFTEAGGIFRIPGSFSFAAQYVAFLYLFITIAMIEFKADPDPWFRRIGHIAIYVALVAGLFSGTRGALLTFPALLIGFACFGLIGTRMMIAAPLAVGAGATIVQLTGLKIGSLFFYGQQLATQYGSNWIFQQIETGLRFGAFGAGIGSSTGAARYAGTGAFRSSIGLESYYAKIAAELGSVGLTIFSLVLILIALRVTAKAFGHRRLPTNPIVAPLAVYIGFNIIFSFKGYVLDTDPGNIFFWLALGIIVELDRAVHEQHDKVQSERAAIALAHGRNIRPLYDGAD